MSNYWGLGGANYENKKAGPDLGRVAAHTKGCQRQKTKRENERERGNTGRYLKGVRRGSFGKKRRNEKRNRMGGKVSGKKKKTF